jgi:hypothetical protein
MRFKKAVRETTGLEHAYRKGLQALSEADRNRIKCAKPRALTGSLNLDETLAESRPNDSRWDYGIGLVAAHNADRVVWVEVHPASSSHIQQVIDKHVWLLRFLNADAPLLDKLPPAFVWVASGRVCIPASSPQRRRLAQLGIRFAGEMLRL